LLALRIKSEIGQFSSNFVNPLLLALFPADGSDVVTATSKDQLLSRFDAVYQTRKVEKGLREKRVGIQQSYKALVLRPHSTESHDLTALIWTRRNCTYTYARQSYCGE